MRKTVNLFCVEADNVCHSLLSCRDHDLSAVGSAVHLYRFPSPQKFVADQLMGVSLPRKSFITVPLALFAMFESPVSFLEAPWMLF